jgi:hypothetical protein
MPVVVEGGSMVNVVEQDFNVGTVNISAGTFTSVAGDNITYYNVTQNIKESDGEPTISDTCAIITHSLFRPGLKNHSRLDLDDQLSPLAPGCVREANPRNGSVVHQEPDIPPMVGQYLWHTLGNWDAYVSPSVFVA